MSDNVNRQRDDQQASGADRRQFPRLIMSLPIKYRIISKQRQMTSSTQDVSTEGLRLFVDEPLAPTMAVALEISWPTRKEPVAFVGEVMWCDRRKGDAAGYGVYEVGIRFIQISRDDHATVMRYIEESHNQRTAPPRTGGRHPDVERRKFPRLNATLSVTYRALSIDLLPSASQDIGGGGLRVLVDESIAAGTPLVMDVQLPDQPARTSFFAEVVWCQAVPPGPRRRVEMGIKFIKISAADRLAIMQYVERAVKGRD